MQDITFTFPCKTLCVLTKSLSNHVKLTRMACFDHCLQVTVCTLESYAFSLKIGMYLRPLSVHFQPDIAPTFSQKTWPHHPKQHNVTYAYSLRIHTLTDSISLIHSNSLVQFC